MPRIKVIEHNQAIGRLNDIYNELVKSRGKLADVHKIQSLRPESIVAHMNLYMEIMYSRSEISRAEREMIGTVVSVANGCIYCTKHHAEALNHYWKDNEKTELLISGNFNQILSAREIELCLFSKHLTTNPQQHENNDYTSNLKKIGLSDSAVLDVVLVTAYFNFVNRIVLSLGVEIEENNGSGYTYE